MKINAEEFTKLLAQSNISLEKKKDLLTNLKYYSETEVEFLYNALKENAQKQKKILANYKRKNKIINLEYEIKIKNELKHLKKTELKWELIKQSELEKKKKMDAIKWIRLSQSIL